MIRFAKSALTIGLIGRGKRAIMLLALPLALLALAGCAGRIATPEGWSGGAVSEDTLYIGTREGDVRAIDTRSGETLRRFTLLGEESARGVYGTPSIHNGTLYVGGYDGVLYALSTPNLELQWQEPIGAPIVGAPTIAGDVALVGADDAKVYAYERETQDLRWAYQTGNKVWSSPAAADGVAYVTSLDKNIYAIDIEDGKRVWQYATNGAIASSPVVDGGVVYVGSFDGVFYAVNAADGSLKWTFRGADGWYWGKPLAHGDSVYAPSLDGNLYALDKHTGELRWTLATGGPIVGSPGVIFDMIAIGSDDGKLHVVRISDGNPVDECNMNTRVRSSLAVQDGVVFLSADDKTIRALRVKTNGNPDEEWVHKPDEDNPVLKGRVEDC